MPENTFVILPAQHGIIAMALCLSQVGVLSKRMDGSSWFLARKLPSTYRTFCYKEIQVSTKQ